MLTPLSVARKLPMDNPDFISYLRMAYVGSQALAFIVYYYITMKVGSSYKLRPTVESEIS